jgi:hypothetical protein
MVRWKGLLCGAVAFALAHAVLAAKWTTWFGGTSEHEPWFLNAGNLAVAFPVVCVFLASVAASAVWAGRDDAPVYGINVAMGATFMMTVALFTVVAGGPGTLFPIAIAIGGLLFFVAGVLGSFIVWPVKHVSHSA